MFSEQSIGWNVKDNFVKDRMIDNSLTHKFASKSKIQRRTKTLNTKIKKYGVKDYKHYVKLKTNTIRSLVKDNDTDNSDNLSDTDYDIIYNSLVQNKDLINDDSETYINTEKDYKDFKKQTNIKSKEEININNTKVSIPKKKLTRAKCDPISVSKKYVNISWQKVTKKNKDISHLSNNQTCINNENTFKDNNDYLKVQSNNQSLSQQFDSQNSTSSITKFIHENMNESCKDSNEVISVSNCQDSTIFNKITSDESEIQNCKKQNAVTRKSNIKLNSQNPLDSLSKYQTFSCKSISSENIEGSDNEISTITKLENNNNNKLAESDRTLINSKNYNNTYENQKSKLLKNAKRNLISVLEEDDLMNKDIEKNKNKEDRLNYDQLLEPISSSTWHSTPKKTCTKVLKNLLPDISSLDQQKDSEFDKNLQDKFDKIEQSNIKNSTNLDITEMLVSPQQFKKVANIETIASKNSKKSINNILEKQEEFFKEEKSSFQLNSIKGINQEISLTNQENKTKFKLKAIESIENQQSSLKESDAKNVCSKSCNNILEKQDSIEEEFSKEKINFLQLSLTNEADKDTEIYLIKHKDKNNLLNQSLCSYKEKDSMETKESCNVQKQQLLFSKKDHVKNVHSKFCDNISKEQDSRKGESFEKEIADVLQSNQIDKNIEIYSINQDKTYSMKDSCKNASIQKQQLLPKITCSKIINKKYTIINKQGISIEKNVNFQEEMSKAKEIDNNILLEIDNNITLGTDNEEDNVNYMSPKSKKRLQQQKKLNLIMSSDSSQSDDEYKTIEISKKNNNDSDINCNKDTFENDVTNCEKINTDILCDKDSSIDNKKVTPIPTKEKENSPNVKKEMRKQADETALLTSYTFENENSSKSATNKNSLKEIQYYRNVCNHNNNQNQSIGDIESFQLKISEDNISCIEGSTNQFFLRNKADLLDKENFCGKSNESEDRMSEYTNELGIKCKPRHEQNKQESTKYSNMHISCHYRPYNVNNVLSLLILFLQQALFDYYFFSYNN